MDVPPTLSYAHVSDTFLRRLAIAGTVVGVLVVLANVAILIGGWDDFRVQRAVYGWSNRLTVSFVVLLAEAALSALAGGYLLYAVRLLRLDAFAGLQHHRRYAAFKLLLAGVAVVGGVLNLGEGDAALAGDVFFGFLILIQLAISAAYPLTLLLLLRPPAST